MDWGSQGLKNALYWTIVIKILLQLNGMGISHDFCGVHFNLRMYMYLFIYLWLWHLNGGLEQEMSVNGQAYAYLVLFLVDEQYRQLTSKVSKHFMS